MPARPTNTIVTDAGGKQVTQAPDVLDISDYQSAKKLADINIQNQTESRQKVFSLVWQQCTEAMHAKVKAHHESKVIEDALNGIELLRVIKLTQNRVTIQAANGTKIVRAAKNLTIE